MPTLHLIRAAALIGAAALVATSSAQQPLPSLPPPRPLNDPQDGKLDQPEPGVRIAEKGPIHEAFAQPGADTRGKGMTAPKAPPPPVPEEPPETRPDGENVRWVPGYWQWDADKEDFIWISGFWRNVPAGRDWQAGKWSQKGGQWHYAPGFWRPVNMNSWRIDLPEPPATVESGPSTPPQDPNAIWIPGAWEYRNEKYVWRAGYWAQPNGNALWQPGQYVVTGSGYAYVPGYWDYPLEDRGLLYAPVYFDEPLWQTPGWCYRPRFAFGFGFGWGNGGLFNSLFIGPGFNNFCYGNFFNPWGSAFYGGWGSPFWGPTFGIGFGFGSAFCGWGGYMPWWGTCRGFVNPLWNQYCWLNRGNPHWAGHVRAGGFARAVGTAPRAPVVANAAIRPRPLSVAPAGVGGAIQSVTRRATQAAAPKPLIQPASQVARSLQTGRAIDPAVKGGGAVKGGPDVRPGVSSSTSLRPLQTTPPIHAGSAQGSPGAGTGSPVIRSGNAGNLNRPGTGNTLPDLGSPAVRPGTAGNLIRPGGGNTLPDLGSPTVRSGDAGNLIRPGNLPVQPGAGRAINPGLPGSQPVIRSGNLPSPGVIGGSRPTLPSAPPTIRSGPSMPSGPVFRPSPGNVGVPRSLPIGPTGGGRSMGPVGGGRPIGGGGGRPGGGKR